VDNLLGRGRVSASLSIGVEDFNKFFTDKVAKVCLTTSNAPPPVFTPCQADASCREFTRISADDIIAAVHQLPDKSLAANPIPTFVLRKIVNLIAPFVAELYNCSLITGHFPARFKEAFITPIVKKPGLDSADVSSYRAISNLLVLSKLLERLVARQLLHFLTVIYFQFRGTTFHLVLVPFVSLHQRYGTPYLITFCNLKLFILLDVI